jgi:hypothetical protein
MGVLIPKGIRRNPVSTAVWLASKRRDKLRDYYLNGSTPPFGSIAYYDYQQDNLANAVKELVNKQVSLLTERGSNANILQNSNNSIETFGVGTPAFNRGEGLVIEDVAVNVVPDSLTATATSWIKRGTGDASVSAVTAPDSDYLMDEIAIDEAANGVHDVRVNIAGLTNDAPLATSLYIKKKAGYSGVIRVQNPQGTIFGRWHVDLSLLDDGIHRITKDSSYVSVINPFVASATGNAGVWFVSHTGQGEQQFYAWQYQQVESSYVSSDIYTTGAAAQREASNEQVSTFLEAQRWIAKGVILSDYYLEGVYLGGVQQGIGVGGMPNVFFGGGTGVVGTFSALVNTSWLNAMFVVGDYRLPVVEYGNSSRLRLDLSGTDLDSDKLTALIGNADSTSSNPFTIDFTTSDYLTNGSIDLAADTLVVDTLMTDAGYDNSSLPAAAMWPVNDFKLSRRFQYNSETGVDSSEFAMIGNASNHLVTKKISANAKELTVQRKIAGVDTSVVLAFTSDIAVGDWISYDIEQSSALGLTFTATNEAADETKTVTDGALTADLVMDATAHIGHRNDGSGYVNQVNSEITVTLL